MKDHVCTFACAAALVAGMAMTLIACGGRQTMASKSAAAYDEAKKKGLPIQAGEHGGHSNEATPGQSAADAATEAGHGAMPGMDHGAMAGVDKPQITTGEHGQMAGMDHSTMAGMDHSKMAGMQHDSSAAGAHNMAGMDHSAMPGMAHRSMPGMQHGSTAAPAPVIEPLTTNAAIARTQPAATLRADEFDAPAPTAMQEAARAALGLSHSMDGAAPMQHEQHPPRPQPPSQHHRDGNGKAS